LDPVPRWRLLLFAGGDFAFNLYWQSAMLYLLFYYTEALHVPIALASLCYALASLWDGLVNLLVGLYAACYARPDRFRHWLTIGAIPLGLSFVLAYLPPPFAPGGNLWLGWILATHLVFRSAYALVNVPYLAMSARISLESTDRAFVAGVRMLLGTLAAVLIAFWTVPLGQWLTGAGSEAGYAASAAVFAGLGSILLMIVGASYRESGLPLVEPARGKGGGPSGVLRNRAFLTLSAAMVSMIVAVSVLDKSVLYYFKYALGDESAGQLTLGWMSAASGIAVPLWLVLSRRLGARAVWILACGACCACLIGLITAVVTTQLAIQLFLVAVQSSIVGLHFAFWALLPDTVEYGQILHGQRAEALIYGVSGLLQRLAIGLGTLVLGLGLDETGLNQAAVGDARYGLVLAVVPLAFFALSAVLMLANPLRKGKHAEIVARL
jgi:GPH family glycoside/pentoside/hexuronide:cation symporter